MDGDEITLTVDDKFGACIICGRSSHKMSALKGEEFPALPDLVSDRSLCMFGVYAIDNKHLVCTEYLHILHIDYII